jgi:hypothetical protein
MRNFKKVTFFVSVPWRYDIGSRWIGALILNLGVIWRWVISRPGCFIPGKDSWYQLNRGWELWRRQKSLAPTESWTSDLSGRSLVAIPTTLLWMLLEHLSHLCNISHGKWGKTAAVVIKSTAPWWVDVKLYAFSASVLHGGVFSSGCV